MIDQIIIKEIYSDFEKTYKLFFINGLLSDENCFRMTVKDEEKEPFPTQNRSDSFTLGAFQNDELVGVVSFERDGKTREKQQHKGILFRMLVSVEYRGLGISKKLIEALLARVKALQDIEQINLTVVSHNSKAIQLYQSFRFEVFSSEKNAVKWKGHYFTENQMVKFLI